MFVHHHPCAPFPYLNHNRREQGNIKFFLIPTIPHTDRLVYTRFWHIVYLAEKFRPNLSHRITKLKTFVKRKIDAEESPVMVGKWEFLGNFSAFNINRVSIWYDSRVNNLLPNSFIENIHIVPFIFNQTGGWYSLLLLISVPLLWKWCALSSANITRSCLPVP